MNTKDNAGKTANSWPEDNLNARQRVGMNLYDYMTMRGLTQQELADRAGISRTSLSSYITARRYPRPAILESLAKCLGVSVGELTDNYQGEDGEREGLSDEAYSAGRMFDMLDERGKRIVRAVLEAEVESVRDSRAEE